MEVFGQDFSGEDLLFDASAHVIVGESRANIPAAGFDQAVFSVPNLRPAHAGQHVAVVVISRIPGINNPLDEPRILIQAVRRVGPVRSGEIGGQAVADRIEAVIADIVCVDIRLCRDDFAAVVVAVGQDIRHGKHAAAPAHRSAAA